MEVSSVFTYEKNILEKILKLCLFLQFLGNIGMSFCIQSQKVMHLS